MGRKIRTEKAAGKPLTCDCGVLGGQVPAPCTLANPAGAEVRKAALGPGWTEKIIIIGFSATSSLVVMGTHTS